MLQTIIRSIGFGIAALMGSARSSARSTRCIRPSPAARARSRRCARSGFGSSPVVVSVLVEAVLLSLVGGLIGGGLAWLAFDGYQTATMNWQSFSQVAFAFAVTPSLLVAGMFFAVVMGLSAACSRPSAPPACRSSPPCGSSRQCGALKGIRVSPFSGQPFSISKISSLSGCWGMS